MRKIPVIEPLEDSPKETKSVILDEAPFSLLREPTYQINGSVDGLLWDRIQRGQKNQSEFLTDAINFGLSDIRKTLETIIPGENERKQNRVHGAHGLSTRLKADLYRRLQKIDAELRATVPGFKLSRFITGCIYSYAKQATAMANNV